MSLTDRMSDGEDRGCFIGVKDFLLFFEFSFVAEVKTVLKGFDLPQKVRQTKLDVKALAL